MRQRMRYLPSWPVLIALMLCAAGSADGAELEVKCGVEALNVWDDVDSGSPYHVTFYLAPAQGAYYPVGVTADDKERGERSTLLCLVRDISPNGDALAPPVDYKRIWWDRASGARRDGAIWRPKCSENYVGVGFMVQASYRKPALDATRCVREDLTVLGAAVTLAGPDQLGGAVYKDWGTLAFENLSVWRVKADDGFDVGAVFVWATRTMPKKNDEVRLLQKTKVRVSE